MTRQRSRGFTLVELIIFIVIVGVGVAGILSVFRTSVASSADPMIRKQAVAIAESLLEEIVLKAYNDPPGGDSGTVRALFDDVQQYQGYNTTTGITDPSGAPVPGLSNYNISPPVTVVTTTIAGQTVRAITVSVTGPQGTIRLTGYRGFY